MSTQPPKDETTLSLYSVNTPNGLKVSPPHLPPGSRCPRRALTHSLLLRGARSQVNIALEELIASGSPVTYTFHGIDMMNNEQKEPWFLAINPNGRIPAVIDNARDGFAVWESAAILVSGLLALFDVSSNGR